jgi:hypothetical protein
MALSVRLCAAALPLLPKELRTSGIAPEGLKTATTKGPKWVASGG